MLTIPGGTNFLQTIPISASKVEKKLHFDRWQATFFVEETETQLMKPIRTSQKERKFFNRNTKSCKTSQVKIHMEPDKYHPYLKGNLTNELCLEMHVSFLDFFTHQSLL